MNELSVEERSWLAGLIYGRIAEYFAHWEDATFSRDELDAVYRERLSEGLAVGHPLPMRDLLRGRMGSCHGRTYTGWIS
jgi:hypothetical protein